MEKEVLLEQLSKGIITVQFTKKDGTDRVMQCTRDFTIIPSEFHPKGGNETNSENGDNICVFDVEKNGWRSFNFSTVKAP